LIKVWDLRFGGKPVLTLADHINSVRKVLNPPHSISLSMVLFVDTQPLQPQFFFIQLAWSPLHSEILVSGGLDRQFNMWAATVPPHNLLCSISEDHFSNAIVGGNIFFSHHPSYLYIIVGFRALQESCLVASANGEIETITFTKQYLQPLIPSKYVFCL